MGEVQAMLLKHNNDTQDEQQWVLHGDPRALSVCDKFVPGRSGAAPFILVLDVKFTAEWVLFTWKASFQIDWLLVRYAVFVYG